MDARSYAVTLSALLKARAEPEALRMTRAILDRLEEQEQAQLDRREQQEQGQGQGQEQEQGQAWVPWSRREAEGADEEGGEGDGEGAGGRRRPALKAPLRVDAALCNVMLQVVMQAGEEGESRRVLSRLRAAGLRPSVRPPPTIPPPKHRPPPSPPPSPSPLNLHPHPHHSTLTLTLTLTRSAPSPSCSHPWSSRARSPRRSRYSTRTVRRGAPPERCPSISS